MCCNRDVCAMWSEAVTCMLQIRIAGFCKATTAEKQQKHSSGLILSDYRFAICRTFVLELQSHGGRPHHCCGRGYRRTRNCCGASQGALLYAMTSRRSSCCCSTPHLPLCPQVGFPVKVLEKSSDLREEGASINIAVNGWRAMDALGVSDILRKQFCRIERYMPRLFCNLTGQTRQHG